MRIRQTVGIAILATALTYAIPNLVCSDSDGPSAPEDGKSETYAVTNGETVSEYQIISRLETKSGTIIIMSSDNGPLYNVVDTHGSIISQKLSEKELQAKHPEMYRHIKHGLAGKGNWAGM